MMDLALSVLALLAGGLAMELFSAAWTPLGYQDEHGSHIAAEAQPCATDCTSETLS